MPSVVFLGEFEVGEISSLRSCGMESRMIEIEVISIRSVSMKKGMVTMTHSVPVHVQPAFSEISIMEDSLLRRKSRRNRSVTTSVLSLILLVDF